MRRLCGILASFFLLTGCVLSVDPVVAETEATIDPRLLGTWEGDDETERVVVSRGEGNAYVIETTSDDGDTVQLAARLGRLGERLVLDVWPAPEDDKLLGPYRDLLIPGHLLYVLEVEADELRVAQLVPDSLLAALQAGEVRLTHTRVGDSVVLHGTTQQLRAELAGYLARPGAIGGPGVWRRARSNGPGAR